MIDRDDGWECDGPTEDRYMSAEQMLAQHVRDMGPDLGREYSVLRHEVVWLHVKWALYRQLYGRSPARIGVLDRSAGHFFGVLHEVLLDDVVLTLARLLEKPQASSGQAKLTLAGLPRLIADAALKKDVQSLLRDARAIALRFALPWRDRRIAHRDLALALEMSGAEALPGISRDNIEEAMAAVRAVLNRLQRHYWDSETRYQGAPIGAGRDADMLVYYLRRGMRAEEEWRQRLHDGKPLPGDFDRYDDI